MARPIPLLPPMTSATLPSNRSGKLVADDLEPDLAAARGARLNVKVPKPRGAQVGAQGSCGYPADTLLLGVLELWQGLDRLLGRAR